MFFALTLSSLGSIAVFLPRFLERPFYLTLFLKSQNYLFVFFFIQFPMTFLSAMSLDIAWWAQALSSHSPLFSLILRINIRRLPLLRFRLAALAAWWAQVESNHRPHAYQACALTF